MALPYRTRRHIRRWVTIVSVVVAAIVITWLISAVWLQRYVVYSREGAKIDMSRPISQKEGVSAVKPEAAGSVSIYYNEGSDAIELSNELHMLNGYYISYDDLSNRMDEIWGELDNIKAGTPVMIDMKGGYGTFYYPSKLAEATPSASVDTNRVETLLSELSRRGFYLIGRFSAFRDYTFGNNHVPCGLYMLSRAGLWMDAGGCFWMDPTNATVLNWVTSIANEIKGLGFHEVLLTDFCFPNSDKYIYNGDKSDALIQAQEHIMQEVQTGYFTVSFGVTSIEFPLNDGRSRMYMESVDASAVQSLFGQATIENPEARLVFLCSTNDTRFDNYSVLRPLWVAKEIEALKAERAKQAAAQQEE